MDLRVIDPVRRVNEMYCDEWDGSAEITLEELEVLLSQLKEKYGKAKIRFDAGHNNVSVLITPCGWGY
jgi:hypothetical protein